MAGKYNEKVKAMAIKALAKHGSRICVIGGTVIDGTQSFGFDKATVSTPAIYKEAVVSRIAHNLIELYNDWVVGIIVCHINANGFESMEMEELVLRKVKATEIDSNLAQQLDNFYRETEESTRVSKLWIACPTLDDCLERNITRLESMFKEQGCFDRAVIEKKVTEFNLKEGIESED